MEKWGFEALFQRMINKKRVDEEIISGYLRNDDKIKFFPPLTIAIIPAAHNAPLREYPKPIFVKRNDASGSTLSTEGMEINMPFQDSTKEIASSQPVHFKWDQSKFIGVAIDGQHRISALRSFVSEHDQDAASKDIPAIFIVFDSALILGRDILQATREIFVDVNSKPKTVDESRLILLNDRDVPAEITRRLIATAFAPSGELTSYAKKKLYTGGNLLVYEALPQELVNVTADKQAADVGKLPPWQFTSAFIIHRMVRSFVIKNDLKEFEELAGTTDIPADVSEDDPDYDAKKEIIDRRKYEEEPEPDETAIFIDSKDFFSFNPKSTLWLADRIIAKWGAAFKAMLTGFTPYHMMIEEFLTRESSLSTPEAKCAFRQLLIAEGNKLTIEQSGGQDSYTFSSPTWNKLQSENPEGGRLVKEAIKLVARLQIAKEGSVVWLSVFQRGMLFDIRGTHKALGIKLDIASREHFSDHFVTCLNELYHRDWFSRDFTHDKKSVWAGIALAYSPSGAPIVDASDGSARRIGLFLRLLVLAYTAKEWDVSLETKQGVKAAFTQLVRSIEKFNIAQSPDSVDASRETARQRLREILEKAAAENNPTDFKPI